MTGIYRITHYKNLFFILKNGIHCQNSSVKNTDFVPIGYPSLIALRNERDVPIEPFGSLADYVPFYFTVKSPMLYVIAQGNDPEVINTSQEDIIYLVSTIEKLNKMGIKYVFTDRHAKLSYAKFFNCYEDIKKLNWDIINSDNWGRKAGVERKEIKQAECLIYKLVTSDALIGIGCKNEKMLSLINQVLSKSNKKFTAKIKKEWYF